VHGIDWILLEQLVQAFEFARTWTELKQALASGRLRIRQCRDLVAGTKILDGTNVVHGHLAGANDADTECP
jgi:hypothetical protein